MYTVSVKDTVTVSDTVSGTDGLSRARGRGAVGCARSQLTTDILRPIITHKTTQAE
jgi:hypothetical protein